jgi:DNA repair protein RadC
VWHLGKLFSKVPAMKPGRKLVELGAPACSDAEILAILIGSGGASFSALDCARDLLDRFGTLSDLMGRPLGEMAGVRGIKAARAVRIAAAYELSRRLIEELHQNA